MQHLYLSLKFHFYSAIRIVYPIGPFYAGPYNAGEEVLSTATLGLILCHSKKYKIENMIGHLITHF